MSSGVMGERTGRVLRGRPGRVWDPRAPVCCVSRPTTASRASRALSSSEKYLRNWAYTLLRGQKWSLGRGAGSVWFHFLWDPQLLCTRTSASLSGTRLPLPGSYSAWAHLGCRPLMAGGCPLNLGEIQGIFLCQKRPLSWLAFLSQTRFQYREWYCTVALV